MHAGKVEPNFCEQGSDGDMAGQKVAVLELLSCGFGEGFANEIQAFAHVVVRQDIGRRVVGLRHDALAHHDRDPTGQGEGLAVIDEQAAGMGEKLHARLQTVGYRVGAVVIPEWRVVALGRLVVQRDKVARVHIFQTQLAIELADQFRRHGLIRQAAHQFEDGLLDQVDRGRFQRLDKAR